MTDSALLRKLQDEQYLYRLASTYAWDEAIEFCDRSIAGIEEAYDANVTANNNNNNNSYEADEYFDEYLNNHNVHLKKEPWLVTRSDMMCQTTKKLSVYEWIRYVHLQIRFADQWGNTPLHSASFCKPPEDMILALFRLARAIRRFASLLVVENNDDRLSDWDRMSSRSSDLSENENTIETAANLIIWAATCKDGSTPLLVASSTGASTDVLHCYLDEIQYYIDNKWLNNEEQSEEWARKTVVRPDFSGVTPLMGWMAYHEVWIQRQLNPSSRNVRDLPKLSDHWEMTKRMLQFATKTDFMDIDDSNEHPAMYTLIQQCASVTLYCPISLLEWVVSPHRQGLANTASPSSTSPDICASTPDRITGKLLFHVAMEARPFAFDSRLKPTNPPRFRARLEKNRIQMIKKFLTWYPDAANVSFQLVKKFASDTMHVEPPSSSTAAPYHGGAMEVRSRSPFLQAISSGMTWWHTLNTATSKEDGDDYMGLVQLLWRLNPGEIASERDEVSGLYPFMLAATTLKSDATRSEERLVVDTTFNLLKKNPELVSGALITSGTEE